MPNKPTQVSNVSNSVVVGGSVSGSVSNFSSVNPTPKNEIDITALLNEISALRQVMKQKATTLEEDSAVGKIADAEKSIKENNLPKALEYLRSAGKWALDVASQIGVPVAIEFIKQALSIK
jgi:hypothetical protein